MCKPCALTVGQPDSKYFQAARFRIRQPENPKQPEQEAGKLGKSQRPMSEDEAVGLIETYLLAKSTELAAQIAEIWDGAEFELTDAETAAAEIVRRLSFASWADLADVVEPLLRQSAAEAAEQALLQLMPAPAVGMATNIRSRAVAWAAERAAADGGRSGGRLVFRQPETQISRFQAA